jgi:3-hydroxy-9,10-secoandrosta-1,3,5(10)-triene-9,17-dione monooxygenase reductase component
MTGARVAAVPRVNRPMVGAAEFRRTMGRYPTGIAVVTSMYQGVPYGFTVNSFVSVSLEPPLLSFCASRTSTTWPAIRAAGRFAVTVLGAGQDEVCRAFAAKGADRFSSFAWSLTSLGQPLLDDAVAWFDCEIAQVYPAGDHEIVLGTILDVGEDSTAVPLVFHRGSVQPLTDPA